MKGLKHLFFDLDHTLWDFERNAKETIEELVDEFRPFMSPQVSHDRFRETYLRHNTRLWADYRQNLIDSKTLRTIRWHLTFEELEVERGDWVDAMGVEYLQRCPKKSYLMPNTIPVLEALSEVFELHLITNGFEETQITKLKSSNLDHFFKTMTAPDHAGVKKPDPGIFEYALQLTGAEKASSVHIGDNYIADIQGALNSGLPVIFYNPEGKENPENVPEIKDLIELTAMFL